MILMGAEKKKIIRIAAAAVLFAAGLLTRQAAAVSAVLFGVSYLCAGYDVLWRALSNILHGDVFDENFLMAVASVGALCIGQFPEGAAVMLFYQVGEWFQARAVAKSRRSISDLMDIRPDYANVQRGGEVKKLDPDEVAVGETIVILPGEKIPLDGVVLSGNSLVDTSALTGESVPRTVRVGDALLSGCINQSGELTARVTKEFGESTVSKILDLVENASSKKSKQEAFITRFARWYTPSVVAAAVLLAAVPPLVAPGAVFSDWLYRALVFLVISCPCALVISVPLSFFAGIGAASRMEPVVCAPGDPFALTEADLPVVLEQYEILAKEMIRRKKEGCGFTFYHYMIDLTGGPCIYKRISGCGSGTEYMAVTPWGELFPCHQFVGDPKYSLGNIWDGVTNTALREEFRSCNAYSRPECRDCWAKLYCSGGCAANAYHATGNIRGVYEYGCELFRKRIECAVMIQIAEKLGDTEE